MLVRVLHGNVGQILDLSDHHAKHRVENGWAAYLSEEELDDPTLPGRIGKMPEPLPVQAPVAVLNEHVLPPNYRIARDPTTTQQAWFVYSPQGKLTQFKQWPTQAAAICEARDHKAMSPADRRAAEDQALADKAAYEEEKRMEMESMRLLAR